MIPLHDVNPTRRRAVVTIALIAINVAVYFWIQPNSDPAQSAAFTYEHAAIPCEVTTSEPLSEVEIVTSTCNQQPEGPPIFPGKRVWVAILVSMFLHGSLMHLGGNMLFLWVFGNNIEDRFGAVRYVGFYLVGGLIATFAHVLTDPSSTVPVVGASGAIAAVMGAYLALYPSVRIRTLIFFVFIMYREISAKWLLSIWFVMQFFDAFNPNSGVAWAAHVGGFVFGVVVGLVMRSLPSGRRPVSAGPY